MFINKDKLKKIIATGMVLVTTSMPVVANAASYKVKSNDTIFSISNKFYGSGDYYVELMAYNNLDDFDLQKGMIINVPDLDELLGSYNTRYNNPISGITINYDKNGAVNGVWLPVKKGGHKFANVYGVMNMGIDYNDMVFNFSDVDTTMIGGVKITYSNDNVTIHFNTINGYESIRLNMFSYTSGVYDPNYYDIDYSNTRFDLCKINGVDLDTHANDNLVGMFLPKIDGTNGYVSVSSNVSLHDNILITCLDDINFSKISGISYGMDGNKVYFNMPLRNGKTEKVYVQLTSKNYCYNNKNHSALRNIYCYKLNGLKVDVDNNGDVIGVYVPVDNQLIYASIINPNSNYKFDYNNFRNINNNSLQIVRNSNKIVGFGLLRNDGKYDYFGVSREFDYNKYDSLFRSNPYYGNNTYNNNNNNNNNSMINIKNNIISHSYVYKFTNKDTLWDLSRDYYGKGSYYKQLMFFNDITNERAVVNGKTLYFPPLDELLDFYKKFNKNKSEVINDKVMVKTI